MIGRLAILGLCLAAGIVEAAAPSVSLRPIAREEVLVLGLKPLQTARPSGVTHSLRPMARPERSVQQVAATRHQPLRGSVCRDRSLRGEEIGRVNGTLSGCGLKDGIRLREVAGVSLSQPAVMDCTTAKALKQWIEKGLKPAVGRRGGGVAKLRVFASYSCRTRNSKKGAKISEHGKGKAIDIGGIVLANGQEISVLKGWGQRREGKILRKAHRAACGPFGTVLGPDSDRYHRDHFHFDTARYRSGSYCR